MKEYRQLSRVNLITNGVIMKGFRAVLTGSIITAIISLLTTTAYARIPEPGNVIYGILPDVSNEIKLIIDGVQITSYTRGDIPQTEENYILRVPLDVLSPPEPGTAVPGDEAELFLDGASAFIAKVIIGERGTIFRLDIHDAEPDVDDDTIPNYLDNCPHAANTDQADNDGDNVGDVCDNCLDFANTDQDDANGDGKGDACDTADSDGDGMPDDWEYRFGLNPDDDADGSGDADGDGTSNILEYEQETNPVLLCGDVSDDTYVDLADLISVMQLLSGMDITTTIGGDCNDDNKIDMGEALIILQMTTQ